MERILVRRDARENGIAVAYERGCGVIARRLDAEDEHVRATRWPLATRLGTARRSARRLASAELVGEPLGEGLGEGLSGSSSP